MPLDETIYVELNDYFWLRDLYLEIWNGNKWIYAFKKPKKWKIFKIEEVKKDEIEVETSNFYITVSFIEEEDVKREE